MKEDYTNHKAEDLLEDSFFIQSVQHQSKETTLFWNRLLDDGKIDCKEYKMAVFFLESVREKKQELPFERRNAIWKNIVEENKNLSRKKTIRFRLWASVAASIAVLVTFFALHRAFDSTGEVDIVKIANSMNRPIETEDIQLILPDRQIPIHGQSTVIRHGSAGIVKIDGDEIPLKTDEADKNLITRLIVPNGKRSTLILEDGTKLWVNAGTRVVYPSVFESNKREIYVDGEVYLDVAPDIKRPFIVSTNRMNVKVLGTSFNVMAYEKDKLHSVVLVSGSVRVKTDNKQSGELKPNNMFTYEDGVSNIKDVDTDYYVSWKDGLYSYNIESLSVVLGRLSRYYGKKMHYDEASISELKCSGKLDMQENLDVIMTGLSETAPITFVKNNDEYTISVKK